MIALPGENRADYTRAPLGLQSQSPPYSGAKFAVSKAEYLAQIADRLDRLTQAVERLSGTPGNQPVRLTDATAYQWQAEPQNLFPINEVNRVPLDLLRGLNGLKLTLEQNTLQFARGFAANNALLWGAKGMGKSSLIKALHADICARDDADLKRLVLVEINREDIATLPLLMRSIANLPAQFIVLCDDLSFDHDGADYKSLKTILDGGLEGRPANVIFYATSNRRHLMPRDMIDNERSTAINPDESVDEKVSLSDRFGLWLGFHNCSQDDYLEMIAGYCAHYDLEVPAEELRSRAISWAQMRGARSGRVAIQLVRQLAGERGKFI